MRAAAMATTFVAELGIRHWPLFVAPQATTCRAVKRIEAEVLP